LDEKFKYSYFHNPSSGKKLINLILGNGNMSNSSNSIELTKSCPKESKFVALSKIESTESEKLSQKGISNDSYSSRTKPYGMKKSLSVNHPYSKRKKRRKRKSISFSEEDDEEDEIDKNNLSDTEELYVSSQAASSAVYCICRKPDLPGEFMIACDCCNEWFHGRCVNISEDKAAKMKDYICRECKRRGLIKRELYSFDDKSKPDSFTRRCLWKDCENYAQPNSKYCSKECGIKNAKEVLRKRDAERVQLLHSSQESNSLSVADCEDLRMLRLIHAQQDTARQTLADLQCRQQQLEQTIAIASTRVHVSSSQQQQQQQQQQQEEEEEEQEYQIYPIRRQLEGEEKQKEFQQQQTQIIQNSINKPEIETMCEAAITTTTIIDKEHSTSCNNIKEKLSSVMEIIKCSTCGQSFSMKNYSRHMEQCLSKRLDHQPTSIVLKSSSKGSSSQTLLCACPTSEFPEGYCKRTKKSCVKHINWESIRRGQLAQEILRQEGLLNSLLEEEKLIQLRMSRRADSLTDPEANRTIVESSNSSVPLF